MALLEREASEREQENSQLRQAKERYAQHLAELEESARRALKELEQAKRENASLTEQADHLAQSVERLQNDNARLEKRSTQDQAKITALVEENKKLRERHLKFSDIQTKLSTKDKKAMEGMNERLSFYESQLGESDQTLQSAREIWSSSHQVLMEENLSLEQSVKKLNKLLAEALDFKNSAQQSKSVLQTKLDKALRDRMRMSEALNELELQLTHKKIECNQLEAERSRLQTKVEQMNTASASASAAAQR